MSYRADSKQDAGLFGAPKVLGQLGDSIEKQAFTIDPENGEHLVKILAHYLKRGYYTQLKPVKQDAHVLVGLEFFTSTGRFRSYGLEDWIGLQTFTWEFGDQMVGFRAL